MPRPPKIAQPAQSSAIPHVFATTRSRFRGRGRGAAHIALVLTFVNRFETKFGPLSRSEASRRGAPAGMQACVDRSAAPSLLRAPPAGARCWASKRTSVYFGDRPHRRFSRGALLKQRAALRARSSTAAHGACVRCGGLDPFQRAAAGSRPNKATVKFGERRSEWSVAGQIADTAQACTSGSARAGPVGHRDCYPDNEDTGSNYVTPSRLHLLRLLTNRGDVDRRQQSWAGQHWHAETSRAYGGAESDPHVRCT